MIRQIKQIIPRVAPPVVRNFLLVQQQRMQLRKLERISCQTLSLPTHINQEALQNAFASQYLNDEWPEVDHQIALLQIPENRGGVNSGDGRAIFYLVRHLRAKSVLEIGSHIGASTTHMAAALRRNQRDDRMGQYHLTTVDLVDINDAKARPWIRFGSPHSPREMVAKIGAADCVTFITDSSLRHLSKCRAKYDFIFLDGDHSATTVYQEIPAALRALNHGGVILLHDYFPGLRPLWSDGALVPGPWLGIQRLRSEGAVMRVLPLGELPWKTKLDSSVSSLALVVGG